ncbi:MAG TPA: hypothetical protein VGI81_27065 [Tepidisphaeraceae bacterium]|jgi:hypothetical protein
MQRPSWCVVLSLTSALSLPALAFGAGGIVVPPGNSNSNNVRNGYGNNMQQPKEPKDLTLRFVASQEAMVGGKKRSVSLFTNINGSGRIQAVVGGKNPADPDPDIQTTVDKLQKGDVVKMKLAQWNGVQAIDYIKKIEVTPAEENPHGFLFEEFYNAPNTGAPIARLLKYGESYEFTFPMVKDEKGKMQPDTAMVDAVQKYKKDQPLYVTFLPPSPGQPYVATTMFPYSDPQTGKVTKLSEQEVDGGKTPAVDIETSDGKAVTALVPGKVNSYKRFTPDSVLAREARMFKPGTEVVFMTRDDNGKSYLVEISRAPKAPPTTPKAGAAEMSGGESRTAKAK